MDEIFERKPKKSSLTRRVLRLWHGRSVRCSLRVYGRIYFATRAGRHDRGRFAPRRCRRGVRPTAGHVGWPSYFRWSRTPRKKRRTYCSSRAVFYLKNGGFFDNILTFHRETWPSFTGKKDGSKKNEIRGPLWNYWHPHSRTKTKGLFINFRFNYFKVFTVGVEYSFKPFEPRMKERKY